MLKDHVLATEKNTRLLSFGEQFKLTKASYQFIMRLRAWGLLSFNHFEELLHELTQSDSPFVTLPETKSIIRRTMKNHLNRNDLAFLDLVLYRKEDGLTVH
jgi:hypothetical protein